MHVEISVSRSGFRRWHADLAARLRRNVADAEVRIRLVEGEAPLPSIVETLLGLERIVLRRSRETPADRLPPPDGSLDPGGEAAPDVIVDCSGRDTPSGPARAGLVVRPLYDGVASDHALVAAVLAHTIPDLAIEDVGSGAILASGRPSGEAADGLTGGIEAIVSRIGVLIESVLRSPGAALHRPIRRHPAPQSRQVVAFAAKTLAARCARAIFHLCLYSPHWRIGWRLHDGPGVLERGHLGGPRWSVLADPGRRFFADPFPVSWQGRTFVFFEDLDHRVGKGVISAIEFGPDGPVGPVVPVLEENWHMSYPFILEHRGALYMVPESSLSGEVPLYRCTEFPHRWERVGTLVDKIEAADCTLFQHDGLFWMMSATREGSGGYSDMLSIHHATDLLGRWTAHARSPALLDVGAARPAGRVVSRNGRLWRPVQDCTLGYGRVLGLAEIDRLDTEHFSQTVRTRIEPGPLWPGKRLHTLNRTGRLECIDGTTYNPRLASARAFAASRMVPGLDPEPREVAAE